MFKKILIPLMVVLLALAVVACNGDGENGPDGEIEAVPPIGEVPDTNGEIEAVPPIGEIPDNNGIVEAVPPIGELPDDFFDIHPVVVNGMDIPGTSLETIGEDEIFPTHVSLMPLDLALGMDVFWNMQTDEASLTGRNGFVTFNVGSADFNVEGETITLIHESVRIGDEIYVPIAFFADIYGAAGAYFHGGTVFIDTEETDMH